MAFCRSPSIPAGSGTVTTVSVVTANGVSGSVADPTQTPAITLDLGAITPSSIVTSGTITSSDVFLRAPFISKTAAPADGELVAGQVSLWFDATNGAAKLMIKGKSANGTVVTGSIALT